MLRRVSPLAGDTILPLADAKLHLRVRHSEEDTLIASLRDAAILHVERVAGVSLALSTFAWTVAQLVGPIALPVRPAVAVTSIVYRDSADAEQTVADPRLANNMAYAPVNSVWPGSYGAATITFTAGFDEPVGDLLAAVKLLLGHWYENREAVNVGNITTALPFAVDALIAPYRDVLV